VTQRQVRAALGGAAVAVLAFLSAVGLALAPREPLVIPVESPESAAELDLLRARLIALEDTLGALASRDARDSRAPSVSARTLPRPFARRVAAGEPRRGADARSGRASPPASDSARWGISAASVRSLIPFGGALSSDFASGRRHPLLGVRRPHRGVDISAPHGAPIVAPASGVVRRVGREVGYGLVLEIDHGDGVVTRYAHCSRVHVRAGETITRGQRVAAVGRSGLASGPHLHYEVHVHGTSVDPLGFTLPGRSPDSTSAAGS
jgi:murein DD-endopeptidase MepM/ murein hydrolase activator NlpD